MGDNGKIYVNEDTVPAYKSLLKDADLILPNQFEAECVSPVCPEISITDATDSSRAYRSQITLL